MNRLPIPPGVPLVSFMVRPDLHLMVTWVEGRREPAEWRLYFKADNQTQWCAMDSGFVTEGDAHDILDLGHALAEKFADRRRDRHEQD